MAEAVAFRRYEGYRPGLDLGSNRVILSRIPTAIERYGPERVPGFSLIQTLSPDIQVARK